MTEYRIGAQLFRDMVISAANYLEINKTLLNDLNVFPVPDGDTGTNMTLTLVSAAREVNAADSDQVGVMVEALSHGALKGARGNSGVILSQLFRGFSRSVPKDQLSLNAEDFADAIQKGVESAYKAVMKPKEGTILTVARAMADAAAKQVEQGANLLTLIDHVIEAGKEMLHKTPDMLPVLKEAGVVDAGGAGLLIIYQGFKMAIDGEEITTELDLSMPVSLPGADARAGISTADIEFGYCTEFFITNLEKNVTQDSVDRLRDKLADIGDSLVVVGDPELIKIHVHTNDPGKALQYALRLGELSQIKIDNMREQHSHIIEEVEKKPMAIVAVAEGDGLRDIFLEFEVDGIVSGGQSMNPSAEDILKEIEKAPSDHIIVLPNNKNIILAAEQAGKMTKKNVVVIPSRSFPQGLSAILVFDPSAPFEQNTERMNDALATVKSGQITRAVRDTSINGDTITEGEVLGIMNGDISVHGNDVKQTFVSLIDKMVEDGDSVISIYYGKEINEASAKEIASLIEQKYVDCDVEVYSGKQPVYDYILSVE